jgi:hypothetical protein
MDSDPVKLRELAAWYREYASQAENLTIWEARLQTAEDLDAEANRIEGVQPKRATDPVRWPV